MISIIIALSFGLLEVTVFYYLLGFLSAKQLKQLILLVCDDAAARVCLSLGTNQMIISLAGFYSFIIPPAIIRKYQCKRKGQNTIKQKGIQKANAQKRHKIGGLVCISN